MAVRTFTLPDLGEGLEEAEIVEWHVSEGDRVVADQPLVSVETDKAVVEVPCPWSGTVSALRAAPGDILKIGDALADFGDDNRDDVGAVVGNLDADIAVHPEPKPRQISPARSASAVQAASIQAVPAARVRARELGVELAEVTGRGPGGAVTRADVEAIVSERAAPRQLTASRRSMARAMARAHAVVVPATVTDVADITAWHSDTADVMVRLVRSICAAVAAEPALNTWYDPDGTFGPQPPGIALGVAADTPQGLYVPVIADIGEMTPDEIRAQLDDVIARVHARQPLSDGVQTPSISLSNFGPIGGRHAALVVTPPQVAILGAGRAYETVVWRDGAPARAVNLPLSLTFDHRAVTGGEAARFLSAAIADLELPDDRTEAP